MRERITQFFTRLRNSGFEISDYSIADPHAWMPGEVDGISIPLELLNFYRTECGAVRTRFIRELTPDQRAAFANTIDDNALAGGPVLLGLKDLAAACQEAHHWAKSTWIAESPVQRTWWTTSLPFCGMMNGDYLAIDREQRIVYLCHDEDSFVLADDFATFWSLWERIHFIGPEWWVLQPFSDESGRLGGDSSNVTPFRNAFAQLLKAD